MLRRVPLRLVAVSQTCVPHNFVFATDLAFYFPRFQPRTHVASASVLPEVRDAIALLQPLTSSSCANMSDKAAHDTSPSSNHTGHACRRDESATVCKETPETTNSRRPAGLQRWSGGFAARHVKITSSSSSTYSSRHSSAGHEEAAAAGAVKASEEHAASRSKALMLIERGLDICEGLGGAQSTNVAVIHMTRPLYALYFELLAGCEHMPRTDYASHMHVHKTILHHAGRLLYYDAPWDRTSVEQLDTSCVILAHFVRSFCALHTRPFNAMVKPTVRLPTVASLRHSKKRNTATTISMSGSSTIHGGNTVVSSSTRTHDDMAHDSPCRSDDHNNTDKNDEADAHRGSTHTQSNAEHSAATGSSSSNSSGSSSRHAKGGELEWWTMSVHPDRPSDVLTLSLVESRLCELSELCARVYRTDPARYPDMRWHAPKLQLLRALLTLAHTGNMFVAKQHIDSAAETVYRMKAGRSPSLDGLHGRTHEVEFGLFLLAQAEMSARMFDWSAEEVGVGEVDGGVLRAFEQAASFYAAPYNDALESDGVMNRSRVHDRAFEVQAYAACQLALAHFLLNAHRPRATSTHDSPIFLPRQLFSTNPLMTVLTPTPDRVYSDVQSVEAMSLAQCRQRIGAALERALQLNRALFPPAQKQNVQAAWILLAMSCMYADVRDYLYAMGLFESASKAMTTCYGARSLEMVLLHKLRYECLAGMGSEQEAATAAHEIVHLLKRMDELAHPLIAK